MHNALSLAQAAEVFSVSSLGQYGAVGLLAAAAVLACITLWRAHNDQVQGRISDLQTVIQANNQALTEVRAALDATQTTMRSLLGAEEQGETATPATTPHPPPPDTTGKGRRSK